MNRQFAKVMIKPRARSLMITYTLVLNTGAVNQNAAALVASQEQLGKTGCGYKSLIIKTTTITNSFCSLGERYILYNHTIEALCECVELVLLNRYKVANKFN